MKWRNSPKVSSHCFNKKPITKESHLDFFDKNIVPGYYQQYIVERVEEQYGVAAYPIATVYLKDIDRVNRRCELCIFTSDDEEWNTESQAIAIKMLLKKAFEELYIHKVYSYVFYKYLDEAELLKRAGFTTVAVGLVKGSPMTEEINNYLKDLDIDKVQEEIMTEMVEITTMEEAPKTFITEVRDIWGKYSSLFLQGIVNTLFIAIISTILGFLIGLLVAIIRRLDVNKRTNPIGYYFHKLINALLSIYVEVFRGTPMMVQSVIIFYGLKQYFDIDLSTMFAAILIVSINTGAYLSEVVRGGINAVDSGQFEACKAIGLTNWQAMTGIILPQTIKTILPSLGNEFVINIKDTSVLNVISVTELFFMSKSVAGSTYQYFPTYLITAVIYLVLTFTITRLLLLLERRFNDRDFILESSTGAINVNTQSK